MKPKEKAFQDYFPGGRCFGCGPANKFLKIKSYWVSREKLETTCNWKIKKNFCEITGDFLNGGVTFALMDCHAIWTAVAARYDMESRPFGSDPMICYVTGGANDIRFIKAIPISAKTLTVLARVKEMNSTSRKCIVETSIWLNGEKYSEATIIAVRKELSEGDVRKVKGEKYNG